MSDSRAWSVASWLLPINAIRSMVVNVTNSVRSIVNSWRGIKDKLRAARARKHEDSMAGERFLAAASRYSLDAEKIESIQQYMSKRKRAGIVMFYISFGSLLMTIMALRPYLAFCAVIMLGACWTFCFVCAFHEQQIREQKLFSVSRYLKKNGYFHPLNWN